MRLQRHAPTALYPGKYPSLFIQVSGWIPEPVWPGPHLDIEEKSFKLYLKFIDWREFYRNYLAHVTASIRLL
jgi:hypothetical protein